MNYKIGDLVTITGNSNHHHFRIGETVRLKHMDNSSIYKSWAAEHLDGHDWWRVYESDMKPARPEIKPQKIVITTDGMTTLARLYNGKTMIKRAEAKCAPSDTFNFNIGADLAFKRLMGIPVIGQGKEESKPEPIKLYCVKSFEPGTWLTKGKIYEADSQFNVKYDDGYCNNYSQTFEQWKSGNQTYADCLVPLVRRPAKIGEWVMPICDSKFGRYKKNQPLKVIDDCLNASQSIWCNVGVVYAHPDCPSYVIENDEYLVLDGYKGESNDDM